MKLILIISCAFIIGYFLINVTQSIAQIYQGKIIYPLTNDELLNTRKSPEKKLDPPVFQAQRKGLIVYFIFFTILILLIILGVMFEPTNFSFYPFLFISLFYLYDLANLFAIVEEGILIGSRFIPWRKIKYFE